MVLYWSMHGEVACAKHAPQQHSALWIDHGWQPVPDSSASYPELLYCEQCRLMSAFDGRARGAGSARAASITERVATLQLGSHACLFYENQDEQFAIAAEYVKQGLARNERCLYVCDDCTHDEVVAALGGAGIDVARETGRGALLIVTTDQAHLDRGRFDVEAMLKMLSHAVEQALDAGFAGLRATGEMTWLLQGAPGTDRAIEYESLMNQFYPTVRAMGLCQYNHARLPAEPLDGALRTHAHVIVDGDLAANIFYEPPAIFNSDPRDRVRWKLAQLRVAAPEPR
jgi:hypothetical protein